VIRATDLSDRKEGTASLDLTIAAAFTSGLIAYHNLSSTVNLNSPKHYSVQLWIKSSVTTMDGLFKLILDDSTGCGSATESINIPVLTANTWKQALLDIATPGAALAAVACVGLTASSDPGAATVTLDLITAPAEVTSVSFIVANALNGEAINLTTITDADTDGLLSDESTKNHVMSIIYSDTDQRTTDMTWTRTELGKGDGDALLEPGEKMKITVITYEANPMPIADTTFSIAMVREQGADLVIERTLPSVLVTEMDLN
jgi:hypothetical protein